MKQIHYLLVILGVIVASCDSYEDYDLNTVNPVAEVDVKNMDGFKVDFMNNSQNAQTYLWQFGDGNISTEREPSYEFELPGAWRIQFAAYSVGYLKADIDSIDIDIPGKTGDASHFIGEYEGTSQMPGGMKIDFTTTTTLVEGENALMFGNLLKTNREKYIGWGYQLVEGTDDYAKIVLEEDGVISIPNQFMYTITGGGWTGSVYIEGRGRYNADTHSLSLEYAELWGDPWDGETITERIIIARKK